MEGLEGVLGFWLGVELVGWEGHLEYEGEEGEEEEVFEGVFEEVYHRLC